MSRQKGKYTTAQMQGYVQLISEQLAHRLLEYTARVDKKEVHLRSVEVEPWWNAVLLCPVCPIITHNHSYYTLYRPRTPYNPTHLNNHGEIGDEVLRYLRCCWGLFCCIRSLISRYIGGWVRLEAFTRLFESCQSARDPNESNT